MIPVADLLTIGGSNDMNLVVRTVQRHCVAWRRQLTGYSTAELALLAETAQWKRGDRRPPIPEALTDALVEALHRDAPGLEPAIARHLAEISVIHLQRHSHPKTTGERP